MGITSSIDNSVEAYKGFDKGLNSINSPPAGYTVTIGGINRINKPYSSSTYTVSIGAPKKVAFLP
jgi:hypothetical protein